MNAIVDSLIQVMGAHPLWAYGLVFALAAVEAVPLLGTLVPGSTAILLISALVPTGVLNAWVLLGAAIPGAILGDAFSYWLGYHYQAELAHFWPFRGHPKLIERGEAFFRRHGGKSVFLARFTPPIRGIGPLVAGLLGMKPARFYAANVASAIPWAVSHVVPGILLGASLKVAGDVANHVAILLLILALGLWLVYRAARYLVYAGPRAAEAARRAVTGWATRHHGWAAQRILGLVEPLQSEAAGLVLLGAVLLGSLWLFFGILEDVVAGDPLVQLDVAIFQFLQDLRIAPIDKLMVAATELGGGGVITAVLLAALAWLSYQRAWPAALYTLAAVGAAQVFTVALKFGLQRARPAEDLYSGWSAFAFPSGHATMSGAIYGFLAYLVAREFRSTGRWLIASGAAGLVLLIGFSRLYLGAHWLSDVAGGWMLSAAWIALLAIAYEHHRPRKIRAGGLIASVLVTIVGVAVIELPRDYSADLAKYARRQTIHVVAAADWWGGAWETLPTWRVDPLGEREEPFTVQWAGHLQALVGELNRRGWREGPHWDLPGFLSWLTPQTEPAELPVLPKLDRGRLPAVELVHQSVGESCSRCRLVLRLWASGYAIPAEGTTHPIWIGGAVLEDLRSFWFLTLPSDASDFTQPLSRVASDVADGRVVHRDDHAKGGTWDGSVLLAREPALAGRP